MSWRVVGASRIGTSHTSTGVPCQDSNWSWPGCSADGRAVLCVFAADGAGTAPEGRAGAEKAMEATAAFLVPRIQAGQAIDETLLSACAAHVAAKVREVAAAAGLAPRDFACTYLGVVCCENASTIVQIGDGGVVLGGTDGLEMPIAPMNGEYANMTNFITDDDLGPLRVVSLPGRFDRVAVFTDGIQRLAVDLTSNVPHTPFFSGFFTVLAGAMPEDEDRLHDALLGFLGCPAVESRTDDDTTLVLAVRTAVEGE